MKKYLLLFLVISYYGFGQNSADVNLSFNNPTASGFTQPSDVVNCVIYSPTSYSKIYLGGFFSSYFGTTANNIVCLNINGGIDTSFMTGIGFDNSVDCLINAPNDKIMVGGNFTKYNGINSNRIILLNSDGSIDNSFLTGSGFNGKVLSIAVQTDGKFIIGGDFTSYNGTSVSKIVRLNNNGSIDSSFLIGTGLNNSVKTIAIQADDKVLIGGAFTLFNGISKNRIVRLNSNGSIDTSYVTTIGFNNNVNTITILPDGKTLIGGDFTTYGAVVNGVTNQANRIIKLNNDGTTNTVFGKGFDSSVFTLALLSNGKVLIGGNFTDFDNKTLNRIMRLNVDGTLDSTFSGNVSNNSIFSIASDNNTIVIGGNFNSTVSTVYDPLNSNRIRTLNNDGSYLSPFADKVGIYPNSSVPNDVMAIAIKSDGRIVVGGNSETYNSSIANSIVLLDNNGYVDSSFSSGTGFTGGSSIAPSYISCIVPQPDGKILVSGYFTKYNNIPFTKYVTRLNSNGSIDNSFSTSSLQNYSRYVICLQPNGKIIFGEGNYTYVNGVPAARIIRLNSDGTIDNSFVSNSGFDIGISSIAQQSDGKILIGGAFTTYNGTSVNTLIRLNTNGSLDNSFVSAIGSRGTGFDNVVNGMVVQSDNKILVIVAKKIIRLNANGSLDNSFALSGNGFDRSVSKIKLQADGKIIVGGSFTNYNGLIANNLIRLNDDGTKDNSFTTEATPNTPVTNSYINDIAIQNDGKILIVGSHFCSVDNKTRSIARLSGSTSLSYSDFSFNQHYIYPNPAKENIYFSGIGNFEYLIYNILGENVLNGKSNDNKININSLKKGIYILKMNIDGEIINRKFIKE